MFAPPPRSVNQDPKKKFHGQIQMVRKLWTTQKLVFALLVATSLGAVSAAAQELQVRTTIDDPDLTDALTATSLVRVVLNDEAATTQDIVASAKADYRRYVGVLYQNGYFSGTVSIEVDGREAQALSPFEIPEQIARIDVVVDPGPPFTFGRAEIVPLAPGTEIPEGFATGAPAESRLISRTARVAVQTWRDQGHAKARLENQTVKALHQKKELDVRLDLDPGPQLTFGTLEIIGNKDVRTDRIAAMAGFPSGELFSDELLDTTQRRISRTGAFNFVLVTEAETPNPDGTIDVVAEVQEQKPRRLGFGGEVGSSDGVLLSAYWFHRNLLGGAERLRFDAEIQQQIEDGAELEFSLGTTFVKPAVFAPEADFRVAASLSRDASDKFREDIFELDTGFDYRFTDDLFVYGGLRLTITRTDLKPGDREFRIMGAPIGVTYDTREVTTDALDGLYVSGELFPFIGQKDADDGVRTELDARYYLSFLEKDALTLAVRGQLGSVFGATSGSVPESFLFLSGGSGTVRGQPFESLGVERDGNTTSGEGFAGLSLEARYRITDTIGAVGFYDYGMITNGDIFNGSSDSHSGAGFGLRYATPVGPVRVDIAAPVSGDTDDGVQFYFGIGQSF